ncbi:MAG: hypothetical protein KC619_03125 [Myxococcales bacterium]|nr:hypothetical protein [Myxococcales bacterium]
MIRAVAVLALLLVPASAHADWDAQVSSRLSLGGGVYVLEQDPAPWPLFELGLRADLLLGENHDEVVRFGPALDLRTEDFRTLEVAGGLAILWPTGSGFGITTTFGAGWGARPEDRDGAFALAEIAFGWRPYDYFSAYAWTAGVYAAGRAQLENGRAWEITIGVQVDLEILFVIPFMFFVELARAHDPD